MSRPEGAHRGVHFFTSFTLQLLGDERWAHLSSLNISSYSRRSPGCARRPPSYCGFQDRPGPGEQVAVAVARSCLRPSREGACCYSDRCVWLRKWLRDEPLRVAQLSEQVCCDRTCASEQNKLKPSGRESLKNWPEESHIAGLREAAHVAAGRGLRMMRRAQLCKRT